MASQTAVLLVNIMPGAFDGIDDVHKGGWEVGDVGDLGKLALDADIGASAVGLDSSDAFGDASCIRGVLFVLSGDMNPMSDYNVDSDYNYKFHPRAR